MHHLWQQVAVLNAVCFKRQIKKEQRIKPGAKQPVRCLTCGVVAASDVSSLQQKLISRSETVVPAVLKLVLHLELYVVNSEAKKLRAGPDPTPS